MPNKKLFVAIPTYKRPHLVALLLQDLLLQVRKPDHFIIVDGDPEGGEVYKILSTSMQHNVPITYVPSNHANLAYQRYLCWCVAKQAGADIIVYFDDDERVFPDNVLSYLTDPFQDNNVVGVGCHIRFGEVSDGSEVTNLRREKRKYFLVSLLGSGRDTLPGGLTPTGHRKTPSDNQSDYMEIDWLRGGVMSFLMSAISNETFSSDLFALDHIRCGLGEDTFLSRRIGAFGKLLYTFRVAVDHPNTDTPKAYPSEAFKYGYAAMYSRRFLNDYYRVYSSPTIADRWSLVKSYIGNVLITWTNFVIKPNKTNFALARGTSLGSFHGLMRPPTAKRLTPDIDWWKEARKALESVQVITSDSK